MSNFMPAPLDHDGDLRAALELLAGTLAFRRLLAIVNNPDRNVSATERPPQIRRFSSFESVGLFEIGNHPALRRPPLQLFLRPRARSRRIATDEESEPAEVLSC